MDCEMGAAAPTPVEYDHVLSTPLLQIFSVYVHTNYDDKPCEVYGSIRATEENRDWSVDLYNRGINEVETIMKYGSLSLIGPKDDAILGTTKVTIDVCLTDRTQGTELIKAKHCLWDPEKEEIIEDSYDKLRRAVIHGEHGFAHVYYTTFQFSLSALVEFQIVDKTDGSCRFSDVYGSVVASYENSRRYCSSSDDEDELKFLKTVLFDKPSDEPVRMMVGTPLKLRSVAIPAYSSLVIRVDLFDSQGQLASGLEEFPVNDYGRIIKSVQSENGCVQVTVNFKNAYRKMYTERALQKCTTVAVAHTSTKDTETKTEETSKYFQDLPEHKLTSLYFNDWRSMPKTETANGLKSWGGCLVEVFSVHIGGINREVSALCGTIEVGDGYIPYYIYKKDWNNDHVIMEDDCKIEVGAPINNCEFFVVLNLKDPLQKLEISRGEFCWSVGNLEGPTFFNSAFNKRICSVVRGADGYTALHYMIFAKAARAIIEVTFFCDKPAGVKTYLYGLIHAYYGGHKYSTAYEKRYYRSRLFDRSYCRPAEVKSGFKVPLSKLAVAVHTKSSLIIEADLKAIDNIDDHSHGDGHDVLDGKVEFVTARSCTVYKDIWSAAESCRILVSVRFEEP